MNKIKRYKAVIKIPNPVWKEIYVEAESACEARLAIKAQYVQILFGPNSASVIDESGDHFVDPREGHNEEGYQTDKMKILECKLMKEVK